MILLSIFFCHLAGEQCIFQLCHHPLRGTRTTANPSMNRLSLTCRITKPMSLVLLRLHFYQKEYLCHKMIWAHTRFLLLELKYFLQYFKCLKCECSKDIMLHKTKTQETINEADQYLHPHKLNSCPRHPHCPSLNYLAKRLNRF